MKNGFHRARPADLRRGIVAVAVVLALLVAGVQVLWVGRMVVRLTVAKVWENRHLDALSRSADSAYGYDYMRYIQFLRSTIPEDASVVVTRTAGRPQFDSGSFLQYFLFPRTVRYCPDVSKDECLRSLAAPAVYFLYGTDLATGGALPDSLVRVEFDDSLGVLVHRLDAEGLGDR
jgi:hypothetical protein